MIHKGKNINLFIDETTDIVTNFTPVSINDIDNISNGSIATIICSFLDKLLIQEKYQLLHILCNKLCVGGQLKIIYIDIDILAMYMYKNKITAVDLNKILPNINSLWSSEDLRNFLAKIMNFVIVEEYNTGINTYTTIERQK